MNLAKKKNLAVRTLNIGKERIVFNVDHLAEIKEAITNQDIRDLVKKGAIYVKDITGRRKIERRKLRRGKGSIRKRLKHGKTHYVLLVRRLRKHVSNLRKKNEISNEKYKLLRKEIKASTFRSKEHIKERISQLT